MLSSSLEAGGAVMGIFFPCRRCAPACLPDCGGAFSGY
jgi:hypothetical protein